MSTLCKHSVRIRAPYQFTKFVPHLKFCEQVSVGLSSSSFMVH